jgi:hypothetical protein
MTLRVNREIGFQVVASTHEFPAGGAAVSLDGGSHFYERGFCQDRIFPNFHKVSPIDLVGSRRGAREKNQHLTTFYPLACHQPYPACALRRNLFREHAPSENIRLLQQPSVITGIFTPTVLAT